MKNNEIARIDARPATVGQLREIITTLTQSIPNDLTFEAANDILARKRDAIDHIQEIFPEEGGDDQISGWMRFYVKVFGSWSVCPQHVKIPEQRKGFNRLVIVDQALTLNQAYDARAKLFRCHRYTEDLDTEVTKNERDPKNGAYAIWIRGGEEADNELADFSAGDLAGNGIKTMTVLEHMLFDLKYFLETGWHLDQKGDFTLCAGSRDLEGQVPSMNWNPSSQTSYLSRDHVDNHGPLLGAREVITT